MTDLGALPDIVAVACVVLNKRQDAGGHNAVGLAEVAVDFLQRQRHLLLQLFQFFWQRQAALLRDDRPGHGAFVLILFCFVWF